jgi:hypothetical protein
VAPQTQSYQEFTKIKIGLEFCDGNLKRNVVAREKTTDREEDSHHHSTKKEMKCLGCCKHCGKTFVQGNGSNDISSSSNNDGSIIGQQSQCKFSHAQRQVIGYRGKFVSDNYCEPKASWSFSTFLSSLRQQQEPQQQRRDETNAMLAYIEMYWRLWAAGNTLHTEKDDECPYL